MKLSEQTMSVLRNFSSINPSIRFKKGNILRTISPGETVLAKAVLEDDIPSEFCIYDLSRFLGVVSMFNNPSFDIHKDHMTIKGAGRKVNYAFAAPEVLALPDDNDPEGDKTQSYECILPHTDLKEIVKALGVLSVPDLVIEGSDGTIKLKATDVDNKDSDTYDITICECDKNASFKAVIKAENLKLMPMDYKAVIYSDGFAHFKGEQAEYWVALEDSSTF